MGTDSLLYSELYQPLDFGGHWFVAPFVDFESRRDPFYEDGKRLAELQSRVGSVGLDFGYQVTRFAEFRVGYERGLISVSTESGGLPEEISDDVEVSGVDFGAVRFLARTDQLDSATFPKHGHRSLIRADLSRESLGGDDDFDRWEAKLSKFWTFGPNTIVGAADGGWSPGGVLPEYAKFKIGGFLSLSGFSRSELRGQSYGVARLAYYRHAFDLYFGAMVEGGNVWQSTDEAALDDLIGTATVFLGKDSRLGPVYLAYGYAQGGTRQPLPCLRPDLLSRRGSGVRRPGPTRRVCLSERTLSYAREVPARPETFPCAASWR